MYVVGVTVVLLVVAGVATVVVLACETLMERRRRWVGWLEAAVVLFVAVDLLGFRIAAVPWLLWLVTVVMVLVGSWRVTQLRRFRAQEHGSLDRQ